MGGLTREEIAQCNLIADKEMTKRVFRLMGGDIISPIDIKHPIQLSVEEATAIVGVSVLKQELTHIVSHLEAVDSRLYGMFLRISKEGAHEGGSVDLND